MNVHYGDDELSVYALAPSLTADAEAIGEHLPQCGECRGRLQFIDELDDAFRDPEMWEAIDLVQTRPQRLEAAMAEYLQIEQEDADAEALLALLLQSPIRFHDVDVDADNRFHTAGVVRKLCRAAHARHEQQPQFSLRIAEAACRIALGLPVLALAVRERANAFRYLGRFAEGLRSLDDAERLFDRSPGTDPFDLAVVWYIRATIYMKSERLQDGVALASKAAIIFRSYGDTLRELSAVMAEACCLALNGDPLKAAGAFERVISIARSTGEREMLARALQNAGVSYLTSGDSSKALPCLVEAMSIFDEILLPTEHARSMWKLATALAAEGRLNESAHQLHDTRAELLRLGLVNDAALATLDWAEVQLALSRTEGVADACSSIVFEFESEGMRRSASLALAYVHESLRSGSVTQTIVREVRAFLEELSAHPEATFDPVFGKSSPDVS